MKLVRLALAFAVIFVCNFLQAQTAPNFENGWKPYGSYDGSHLDTVNLMNGNLMLHLPLPGSLPQRGAIAADPVAYVSSKDWQVACTPDTSAPTGRICRWQKGGTGVTIRRPFDVSVHRTLTKLGSGTGTVTFLAAGYTILSADGGSHKLYGVPGTEDTTGEPTQFESTDLTGYQLQVSNADINGIMNNFTLIDRHGTVYQGPFPATGTGCNHIQGNQLSGGSHAALIDDAPFGQSTCSETGFPTSITDSNGNHIDLDQINTLVASLTYTGTQSGTDTLGRALPPTGDVASDPGPCVSTHSITSTTNFNYRAPDGTARQAKFCSAEINIQTAFNISFGATPVQEAVTGTLNLHFIPIVSIVLADGSHWTFDYDSYGNLIYVGLPTGGSITYTWTTINFVNCTPANPTPVSRAVATRTLDDGQGHTYLWRYQWGTASSGAITNLVTDPANNDVAHAFTTQGTAGCNLFETSTTEYQGSQSANQVLSRVDTLFSSTVFNTDTDTSSGNIFATDVTTTVYPSGKVKKVHKDPDAGPGSGQPIFGNVKKELEYDWGPGAPGALLRETDTSYKWETNPAYLTAHLLDLPVAVIVKDGSGNRVAETDYAYDEAAYLTASGVTTQHGAPPYGVRGNQSTVSHWLNTTNSFISSHTNWYDTGEVYQKIDPLNHTTTYSYDPAYVGGYVTETCSPQTGSVTHCVSGTYDFSTGVLTSLTNENATTQAAGNTQGDSAHTSNYTYDFMFRIASAQAPPDSANSGARAQNTFTFSAPNTFPVSMQRTKSITNALSDSATSFFDGLGRSYKSQHAVPGNTATVDTTFDAAGHPATVSNPYFSTADPTYGITTSQYDALDRVTQVTKQDGSISSVSYNVAVSLSSNCTDTTDEAGKQRRTCSDALGRLVEVDEPNPGAAATAAQATIAINGSEQANPLPALGGSGAIIISGAEGTSQVCTDPEPPAHPVCHNVPDGGTIGLKVGTYTPVYVTYGSGSTGATLASAMQLTFHNDPSSPVDAAIDPGNNAKINFTARTTGAATNYALTFYNDVDFSVSGLATLTGGRDAGSSPDSGTVTITVNGTAYSTSYGGSDTGATIATRLASAISAGAFANASASGNAITLTAKSTGPGGDYAFSASSTYDSAHFGGPSFTPSAASGSMANGYGASDLGNQSFVTQYQYDALGNLLRVDQKGTAPTDSTQWRTRTFVYDSLSRLLTATNPESGTISYVYDADGSLLQKTSPAPNQTGSATQTVSYCYDELHRVTGKGYGAQSCPLSSAVASYVYDSGANAKGKLVSLTDQAGTASYTYDTLGRLTAETRTLTGAGGSAISKNLSYEYNLDGSLKALHYPSGAVVTYTPDSAGRVLSAVDSGNNISYATGATYGPDGALTGFVSGYSSSFAGITNAFAYNKRLQPLTMSATAPSQTVYSIGYDFHAGTGTPGSGTNNGNVFGIYNYKDANRNQTFTYDALNRLTSAQNAGTDCTAKILQNKSEYWGNSYVYDAWGNMLQKSITKCGAENLQVTADAHNWIHASNVGSPDYQYDAAGNMTYDATASLNYTFDQENRITGAGGYTYTYDGDGNRVKKSNTTTGTLYWYMTPGIVGESDLSGNLTDEYIFFDGERIARKSTNGVFYYFSDHLKTASVVTDSLGNIKSESDFYPWGGELQFTNNDSNHYKFTGKERDSETGLDYFGARYYSNGLGRWVSADWSPTPIPVPYANFHNPQSLNLYGFVGGNPASKADPDGHDGGATATFFAALEYAGEVAIGGPVLIAAAPGAVGLALVASHDPIANHPADDPPSAGNMMLDALNPPYIAAPASTGPYDVGSAADLKGGSVVGDGLDVHHVPQQQPAGQVIDGYDGKTAPAIALPKGEHQAIPTDKGQAKTDARGQLAKDVKDLRNKTKAPNSKIKELIKKNKEKYPEMNKTKPQPKPKQDQSS